MKHTVLLISYCFNNICVHVRINMLKIHVSDRQENADGNIGRVQFA